MAHGRRRESGAARVAESVTSAKERLRTFEGSSPVVMAVTGEFYAVFCEGEPVRQAVRDPMAPELGDDLPLARRLSRPHF